MGFRTVAPEPSVETETRLVIPGVDTFGPGDIHLDGGVGLAFRKRDSDGAIIGDAPAVAKDAPAGIYIPDASTFPSLTLRNDGGAIYLTLLEALIAGTTPAAGTASSDCYGLRVTGSNSGQQDVRLSVEAQREYRWSGQDLETLGGWSGSGGLVGDRWGVARRIQPTADITVGGVNLATRADTGTDPGNVPKRVDLMDEAWNVLATTEETTTTLAAEPDTTRLPFTSSVDLVQDTVYHLGWVLDLGVADVRIDGGSGSWTGSLASPSPLEPGGWYRSDDQAWDAPWADAVLNQQSSGSSIVTFRFDLDGSPGGVLIDGNMGLSVVTFGAPPNVPTQINTRTQWATEVG